MIQHTIVLKIMVNNVKIIIVTVNVFLSKKKERLCEKYSSIVIEYGNL